MILAIHTAPKQLSDDALLEIASVTKPEALEGIVVLEEPGSFSAVRSAVVIGNTLALARGIPVVLDPDFAKGEARIRKGENSFPLAPHYDREPNITVAKH